MIVFLFILLEQIVHADIQEGTVLASSGKSVSYEAEIFDNSAQTLIFMPGIFRGFSTLHTQDELLDICKKNKINWVAFHFAGHPQSLIDNASTNSGADDTSLAAMKNETFSVVKKLQIKNPLYVSLSYSSTVASTFSKDEMPFYIETSPLGRQDESNPLLTPFVEATDNFCSMPFAQFNPSCFAWLQQKQAAYFTYWANKVDTSIAFVYPQLRLEPMRSRAISGYVGMAKAVEKYDFSKLDFKNAPQRIFILGENEDSNRFKIQMAAINAIKAQTGEYPCVFIIKNAGHIVPVDQPVAYFQVLSLIMNNTMPKNKFNRVSQSGELSPFEPKDISL